MTSKKTLALAGIASLLLVTACSVPTPTQQAGNTKPGTGTATGSALVVALSTLFPDHDIDNESMLFGGGSRGGFGRPAAERDKKIEKKADKKAFSPVEPGS